MVKCASMIFGGKIWVGNQYNSLLSLSLFICLHALFCKKPLKKLVLKMPNCQQTSSAIPDHHDWVKKLYDSFFYKIRGLVDIWNLEALTMAVGGGGVQGHISDFLSLDIWQHSRNSIFAWFHDPLKVWKKSEKLNFWVTGMYHIPLESLFLVDYRSTNILW